MVRKLLVSLMAHVDERGQVGLRDVDSGSPDFVQRLRVALCPLGNDRGLTGRMMDAQEAERAGLIARIVPAARLVASAS